MTNFTRKIDDLGRIAIPKEVRKKLSWFPGDEIEMRFEDTTITLQKYTPAIGDKINYVKQFIAENPEVDEIKDRDALLAALDAALAALN